MFCLFIVHFCILPKTLYEEDPIHFWKHKIWRCHFFFLSYINTRVQCCHSYETLTHKICSFWPNLFRMAKCLVGVMSFLTLEKHLPSVHGEVLVQWCIMIIVKGSLSSKTSKVCQTALGSSQLIQGISVLQNDVWRQWPLWPSCVHCYQTICGHSEVSNPRRPTNYRQLDKRQFEFCIRKLGSDSLSSPDCTELLHPLGTPQGDWGTEKGGVGWWGAFTCFKNLMKAGQSGLGHHHGWWDFCIPTWPGNQVTGFSLAFRKWEPTSEIQEIEKHFRTDDPGLLCQIQSCGLCPTPGQESSQLWVVHQHLPAKGLHGLKRMPSKHLRLWPASPPQQHECPNCCCHSGLPGGKLLSAGHLTPTLPPLSSLWFVSVPSSEAAVGEEAVSGHQRCWSLLWGRDIWHTSVSVVWCHGLMVCKDDQVCAC